MHSSESETDQHQHGGLHLTHLTLHQAVRLGIMAPTDSTPSYKNNNKKSFYDNQASLNWFYFHSGSCAVWNCCSVRCSQLDRAFKSVKSILLPVLHLCFELCWIKLYAKWSDKQGVPHQSLHGTFIRKAFQTVSCSMQVLRGWPPSE